MNPAVYAIRYKAVMLVFIMMVLMGGFLSYHKLGCLEDPDFTIKTAVIITQYPGATAKEVEQEVTERLERAVQWIKELKEVRSISRPGLSIIYVDIEDKYRNTMRQIWDELRRKIREIARELPVGCSEPLINDDFGDVFGIFLAVTGDGYSPRELRKFSEELRREISLCDNVGRVSFWGAQIDVVYVEIDRNKLATLGISPEAIFATINNHNAVISSGDIRVEDYNIDLRISGKTAKVEDLGEILIRGGEQRLIRLKDVARISRGYMDPPRNILRRNGDLAIGLGVSVISGGNVVEMGEAVEKKLSELSGKIPVGVKLHYISNQPQTVKESVSGFTMNLFLAVFIVILLLVVFMGWREGLIIAIVLLLTTSGTFMGMDLLDVTMQRISIGALIIALGMLVDNAIVVTECIVIKLHDGQKIIDAAAEAVRETQWPLFGATTIAIIAFAAISVSEDVTGEFLGSLFTVVAISLSLSWIFAITVCPYLCFVLLPEKIELKGGLYDGRFYRIYRRFLCLCINHRWLSLCFVIILFVLSLRGFMLLPQNFFPNANRPQFMVNLWFPQGTHIELTDQKLGEIAKYIASFEEVDNINTFIGGGTLRFILPYMPEAESSNYGQLLVDVSDFREIKALLPIIQNHLEKNYPEAVVKVESFVFGPGGGAVELRIIGPDITILRQLAEQTENVMRSEENTRSIRHNWAEPVRIGLVQLAEERARNIGVSRTEIANSMAMTFDGRVSGVYRDGDDLLPIMIRLPSKQRLGISELHNVQVWSQASNQFIPIEQVTDGVQINWEDGEIHRLNRMRTISISCHQRKGTADALFRHLRPLIEAIPIPVDYKMEWGGEYEESEEANEKLMANVPLSFALMFLITVMLFNSLRHPLIIFLGLPLALIGVSAGLLIANQPFNFLATLGFLSLSGMLIKNEIVLLDQIDLDIASGKKVGDAVIDAAVSRVRPVCMAAFTTVLGMIPLLWDAFFISMAITIMGGLSFATLLTLIFVPVLYAILFKVKI